jgi:hypothetical protein
MALLVSALSGSDHPTLDTAPAVQDYQIPEDRLTRLPASKRIRPMNEALEDLKRWLAKLPVGAVSDTQTRILLNFLTQAWDSFSGSKETCMADFKLARMEQAEWHPPVLTFIVERHGTMVLRSTKAELQAWTVDVDKLAAYPRQSPTCEGTGCRGCCPHRFRVRRRSASLAFRPAGSTGLDPRLHSRQRQADSGRSTQAIPGCAPCGAVYARMGQRRGQA